MLYYGQFTPDLRKRLIDHAGTEDLDGHYGLMRRLMVGLHRPEGMNPPDFSRYWEGENLPEGTVINSFGVAMVPGGFHHFVDRRPPLRNAKSLADIEAFPFEDYALFDPEPMRRAVREAHAKGSIAWSWIGHMFETAWQIRGMEDFLIDMVENPAWAECLLDRIIQQNRIKALAALEAGVDVIACGDDVANQITMTVTPSLWRELLHSRWKRLWAELKAVKPDCIIWYHSDGNVIEILPDLIAAGVDIFNPLQPECNDVEKTLEEHGNRLVFDGLIGTQTTMPFGTPEDVRERVRWLASKGRDRGGLILSPSHILEPEVPIANIDALFDECRKCCGAPPN